MKPLTLQSLPSRRLGMLVGAAVAAAFAAIAAVVGLPLGVFTSSFTVPQALLVFGLPTLVAGGLGGRLLGPRAWRTTSRRGWLGVVLGLGVLAVLIGDVGVATVASVISIDAWAAEEPIQAILRLAIIIGVYSLFGAIVVGPFVLPITLAAAAIWATIMIRLRPREALPA